MNSWATFFRDISNKDYSKTLNVFLNEEYQRYICYPPRELLFNAFNLTPVENVKVVIIGQDPYHEPGQAMGLSFSVPDGTKVPPSLVNIYKEIENEFSISIDKNQGNLTYLAKQGVLMLNAILSVRAHQAFSHNVPEYALFFQDVLTYLDNLNQPIVFLLWGGPAKKLKKYLHNPHHLILEAAHPSPLSANQGGWFGNGHFKKANEYLSSNGVDPIIWHKNIEK